MPALDIFSSSAFSMVALTDAINHMPYVPGRIGQLGLFREQGVSTTSVMVEEREGKAQRIGEELVGRGLLLPHALPVKDQQVLARSRQAGEVGRLDQSASGTNRRLLRRRWGYQQPDLFRDIGETPVMA
jgi:Phage major capsid protein E